MVSVQPCTDGTLPGFLWRTQDGREGPCRSYDPADPDGGASALIAVMGDAGNMELRARFAQERGSSGAGSESMVQSSHPQPSQ